MTDRVRITDVSPRDGLQNEAGVIGAPAKAELVRLVAASGVDEVEVSSFVSPKWVPQLGDAAEVFALVAADKPDGVVYSALVPNERGMDRLLEVNRQARQSHGIERLIDKVSVFTAASEVFSAKNTNASIDETIERFRPIVPIAHQHGLCVRGYVSCVVKCPIDGDIEPAAVGEVVSRLLAIGVDEIDLGDTIGAANPDSIEVVIIEAIGRLDGRRLNSFDQPTLTLHLHDTFGNAAACVERALEIGVRSFDGSAGGLGGCPYSSVGGKRAPGNVATSVLAGIARRLGYETGIDDTKLARASACAQAIIAGASS